MPRRPPALHHAFDEVRFGPTRILNLRAMLPTAAQAVARAEAWLREKQASQAREVLVITGRGRRSADGVPVVRTAIVQLLASLRRRGVVRSVTEHTPGSFVVALAPLSALREAPRRRREPRAAPRADPEALAGLAPETRALLRRVALRALEVLGVQEPEAFVEAEMVAQFAHIARAIPEGPDREERLRSALSAVLVEYDDS
ncbi:MAG: Smr/MutS family protein [Gemmatimonadaceae bacterium]|nr:Smr/MutS family protein [Gemmatimonadaceae bacterium]